MMATVKKGTLTPPPASAGWWKHLRRDGKRWFWRRERKAAKRWIAERVERERAA